MSKVYLVTSGCYSDYSISGVFSTREKAEQWATVCHYDLTDQGYDGSRLEEFDLDEGLVEMDRGLLLFAVDIRQNGDILEVSEGGHPSSVGPIDSWSTYSGMHARQPPRQTVYVWARDKEHAVKIANERRIDALARNVPVHGPATSQSDAAGEQSSGEAKS